MNKKWSPEQKKEIVDKVVEARNAGQSIEEALTTLYPDVTPMAFRLWNASIYGSKKKKPVVHNAPPL